VHRFYHVTLLHYFVQFSLNHRSLLTTGHFTVILLAGVQNSNSIHVHHRCISINANQFQEWEGAKYISYNEDASMLNGLLSVNYSLLVIM
jgi:hypothetical protein